MDCTKLLIELLKAVQKMSVLIILGLIGLFLLPVVFPQLFTRSLPPEYQCRRNLQQIHLAVMLYSDHHQRLPPAFVHGPDGKPWHSWRVLILPALGEQKLYDQYRFDEPWDGPHNRKLLSQMPKVFRCGLPNNTTSSTVTNYLAVVGPQTPWPGETSAKLDSLFSAKRARTVLLVESKDSGIAWLAPDDLTFEEGSAVPTGLPGRRPSSHHVGNGDTGGAYVVFADGNVEFIPRFIESSRNIDAETWRNMLTGETVSDAK